MKYAADRKDSLVRIWRSKDGCTWTEIEPPRFQDFQLLSLQLCETEQGQLGVIWQETHDEEEGESRTTFFCSVFADETWSEPRVLFNRNEYCAIEDVTVLEDGSILIIWDEAHFITYEVGDRTVRGSGCTIVYRAYVNKSDVINKNDVTIEQVMEPESEKYCRMSAVSLVKNGQRIWCVFRYGDWSSDSLYRSWSADGKTWSTPEQFEIPGVNVEEVFFLPDGTICAIGRKEEDFWTRPATHYFLCYSQDWKQWNRQELFSFDRSPVSVMLTEHESRIWGFATGFGGFSLRIPDHPHTLTSGSDYLRRLYLATGFLSLCLAFLLSLHWLGSKEGK
ncbi:MAG: exo-alpha-sialidase [Theionarchaea archaeon]|nr:exo-alpha-sialidase [Theionarchaea archaeon]